MPESLFVISVVMCCCFVHVIACSSLLGKIFCFFVVVFACLLCVHALVLFP